MINFMNNLDNYNLKTTMRSKFVITGLIFTILSCSKTTNTTTSSSENNPGIINPPANTSKVPIAPGDFTIKFITNNSSLLSWTDLSINETGFKIERSINNSSFVELVTLPVNTTSFIDSNLNPSTIYTYRVYAFNSSGVSSFSNNFNITTTVFPVIQANVATKFNDIAILITGKIINTGGVTLGAFGAWPCSQGIIWSTSPIDLSNPFNNTNSYVAPPGYVLPGLTSIKGDSSISSYIYDLKPSTKYHIRFFLNNGKTLMCSNEITVTTKPTPSLTVGQSYQGGYLAYYFQPKDTLYDQNIAHGLIVAPIDQSSGSNWGSLYAGAEYSKLKMGLGEGKSNTDYIRSSGGSIGINPSIAGMMCDTLTISGKSDWFLPSADELYAIYKNSSKIPGMQNTGSPIIYWSSTFKGFNSSNLATYYYIDFGAYLSSPGANFYQNSTQGSKFRIRAVRYF